MEEVVKLEEASLLGSSSEDNKKWYFERHNWIELPFTIKNFLRTVQIFQVLLPKGIL